MKLQKIHHALGFVAVVVLLGAQTPDAMAQSPTYRSVCHVVGAAPQEPLGDREGHAISVTSCTCRVEGGDLDGGVLTGKSFSYVVRPAGSSQFAIEVKVE
jgi:hypothetical protein